MHQVRQLESLSSSGNVTGSQTLAERHDVVRFLAPFAAVCPLSVSRRRMSETHGRQNEARESI